MKLCRLYIMLVLILMATMYDHGHGKSAIGNGYQVTLAVPNEYSLGFTGRAFLMETSQVQPTFRVALSVEAFKERYSCSLEVFLGDVRVWNSGHYSPFYTTDRCLVELTKDGDLLLKGSRDQVGWRTGTSGQGVEIAQRLVILGNGNLVLVDRLNLIKWQSFNFPTDVMLRGQRLNVATRLTSFPRDNNNSTLFFYTLEIQHTRVALYLCSSGKRNYSYWEFRPDPKGNNISFLEVAATGLEFFNDKYDEFTQIPSETTSVQHLRPLRFLSLGNRTGNLGLYFYNPDEGIFQAVFQALTSTCDLPLACRPYGICTLSDSCSCIRLITKGSPSPSPSPSPGNCNAGFPADFCGQEAEMLELSGVTSVLRGASSTANTTKQGCASSCHEDCKCLAALYIMYLPDGDPNSGDCYMYEVVVGVKQVDESTGGGLTYMVKVPKGSELGGLWKSGGVKRWVLTLVGVVDGLIILLVLGGLGFYFVRKRRKNLPPPVHDDT